LLPLLLLPLLLLLLLLPLLLVLLLLREVDAWLLLGRSDQKVCQVWLFCYCCRCCLCWLLLLGHWQPVTHS
jgi:hypothetical protein